MSSLRILFYSHDSYGLGHTSRALRIADHVTSSLADCSVLLLTDLKIIGRFRLPTNVDFVHLPNVSIEDDRYSAKNLNIEPEITLKIRCKIAQAAAKTFKPHMIIIDRDPLALPEEMTTVLSYVREKLPATKIIWALQDVLSHDFDVAGQWRQVGFARVLETLCDEVWVLGAKEIFDYSTEYRLPTSLSQKIYYTNYLQASAGEANDKRNGIFENGHKLPSVLVTGGSGPGSYPLIDNYLQFLETTPTGAPFKSVVITGPMMPSAERDGLKQRAKKLTNMEFHRFSKHFLDYVKDADVIVGTGGYNTLCEILSFRKHAIMVPDGAHLNGHFARTKVFQKLGLIEFMDQKGLEPGKLGDQISQLLASASKGDQGSQPNSVVIDGLARIVERIKAHLL